MCAVVEPTIARRLRDVREHLLERIFGIPQPHRTDSGGVDQQASAGQPQQITGDRGVPTL